MRRRNARDHRFGFTLAELLVATTMMAIVLSAAYTALSSGLNTVRSADRGYAVDADGRFALQLLERDIRSVPPYARHHFSGDEDRLEMVTLTPPMDVEAGAEARLMWVEYRLAGNRNAEGRRLIREEAPLEGPIPPLARGVVVQSPELGSDAKFVIAERVDAFHLRYRWLGAQGRFVRSEKTDAALPYATEISLRFEPDDERVGAEFALLVVPRNGTSPLPEHLFTEPVDPGGAR